MSKFEIHFTAIHRTSGMKIKASTVYTIRRKNPRWIDAMRKFEKSMGRSFKDVLITRIGSR